MTLLERISKTYGVLESAAITHGPELADQIVLNGRIIESLAVAFTLLLIVVGVPLLRYGLSFVCDTSCHGLHKEVVVPCCGLVCTVFGAVGFFINVQWFVSAWFTPKLYLIQYFASLIK